MKHSECPSAHLTIDLLHVATIIDEVAADERRQASQAGLCYSTAQSFCCRMPNELCDLFSKKGAQQEVDLVAIFQ